MQDKHNAIDWRDKTKFPTLYERKHKGYTIDMASSRDDLRGNGDDWKHDRILETKVKL